MVCKEKKWLTLPTVYAGKIKFFLIFTKLTGIKNFNSLANIKNYLNYIYIYMSQINWFYSISSNNLA